MKGDPVPNYQFYLDRFEVTDTRSFHKDTLLAGFGVIVNGTTFGPVTAQLGRFNNGIYGFWQHGLGSLDNIPIARADKVAFRYAIFNNGHDHRPDEASLISDLKSDLPKLLSTVPTIATSTSKFRYLDHDGIYGHDGPGPPTGSGEQWTGESGKGGDPTLVRNIFTGGLYSLIKYFTKSCDGIVAFGGLATTGANLEYHMTNGVLSYTDVCTSDSMGVDKPCNRSGSRYLVNWLVQKRN